MRDKDAVSAAAMAAEMTLFHVSKGKTVIERLNELYKKYGYFKEILISKTFEGQEGKEKIEAIMKTLRDNRPDTFGNQEIVKVKDYLKSVEYDLTGGKESEITLPQANVLQFILADESIVSARPSGTEPKIKFYASCRSNPGNELSKAEAAVSQKVSDIRDEIERLFE